MKRKTANRRSPFRVDVLTIFPRMFEGFFSESLLGKARQKGLADLRVHDIREHAEGRHRNVDDRPYGGGPGMVLMAEPVFRALRAAGVPEKPRKRSGPFVVFLSPQGKPLTQSLVRELGRKKHLVLLCGHYEGVDERVFDWIDLEVAVGEAVYTGGEAPAMALVDAVVREIPGVVKERDSLVWDSFAEGWNGGLDCPHYTRPAVWRGRRVPDVLLSGDHGRIHEWRREQAARNTRRKRPDLYQKISSRRNSE
jgi:tRNA (guanine37-N1)-methyltransferase